MKIGSHIIASGIISVLVGHYFKSISCAFVSFFAGTLIDVDHLVDYYANHPFTLDIKKIYDACSLVNLTRLYLVLHSYELLALGWGAIWFFGLGNFWKAAAVGFTQHLIFDQMVNPIAAGGYFFFYRMARGFSRKLLIRTA